MGDSHGERVGTLAVLSGYIVVNSLSVSVIKVCNATIL